MNIYNYIHKKNYILPGVVLIVFCSISPPAIAHPDDYKEEAEQLIPIREASYTHAELIEKYEPHLHSEAVKKLNAYFSVIFREDFPKPPSMHTPEMIIEGYQCLYARIRDTTSLTNEEKKKETQLKEIRKTIAFHKKAIAKFDSVLAAELPDIGCEACIDRKKQKVLFKKSHRSYALVNDE